MKRFLTHHDIANQVRMMRGAYKGSVVLVEGDSDARVYKKFVDDKRCRVIPANGKSNVLNALDVLEESSVLGVLAIVDNDFWQLDGVEPESDNILSTDAHDLETMITSSGALDVILEEFGAPRKINRIGSIRDTLLKIAVPIGYIRWISSSKQENLSLRFKEMSFLTIIDFTGGTMKLNIDRLIKEVKRHSRDVSFDELHVRSRLSELLRKHEHDPWQVSRGHDMVHILTIGLRNVFGNRHAKSIGYDHIDRILRISFGYLEFSRTKLFAAIEDWEKANKDYPVLFHRKQDV